MSWIIFIICILLSLALEKEKQEFLGICAAIALPVAGLVGFGIFRNEHICNIIFWTIFLLLASFLIFEDTYMKIFYFIKQQLHK